MIETEEKEKIECITCFNDSRFVLKGIELRQVEPKAWDVLLQCAKCYSVITIQWHKGQMREHVYNQLQNVIHLVPNVEPKNIEKEWAYDYDPSIKNYNMSKKTRVKEWTAL